jgi:uncharacterized protein
LSIQILHFAQSAKLGAANAMANEFAPPNKIDDSTLSQLACPACHGDLRLEGEGVDCESCGRTYPIVDGIAVLIAGRASSGSRG